MSKILKIENIVDSVSITHKFPNPEVIFLNTSDILEGKILCHDYSNVSTLKGQAKKTIKNGDILFSEIRPKNKRYAFVNVSKPEDYVVSTKLMVLRNKNKDVLTEYFYYFLTYSGTLNYLQMRAENRIGSFPQITFDILKPISLDIPEIDVQSRIVKLISALDRKIELNDRINAELEAMAKTVYDYWFVQFDFPDENGKPYKSSGGKMVWSDELKREIPEGWEVKRLGDIAKTGSGGTPKSTKKEYYENGKVPWINSGELNNPFIVDTENYITDVGLSKSNAKIFPKNTILIAMYGATAGKTSIISFEASTNQAICAIMPLNSELLYYTKFVLDNMYQYLVNLSSGSARSNLSQEGIRNLNIVIPNKDVLVKFSNLVISYFSMIENELHEIKKLAELRDWLLPMLMNGQVKVN